MRRVERKRKGGEEKKRAEDREHTHLDEAAREEKHLVARHALHVDVLARQDDDRHEQVDEREGARRGEPPEDL